MKRITSATVFPDAVGMRLSGTYAEIDDKGNITSDNKRFDRVIADKTNVALAQKLLDYAASVIEEA